MWSIKLMTAQHSTGNLWQQKTLKNEVIIAVTNTT